jgi:hypothetical protein
MIHAGSGKKQTAVSGFRVQETTVIVLVIRGRRV